MSQAPLVARSPSTSAFLALNHVELVRLDKAGAACSSDVGSWLEGTPEAGIPAAVVALADAALSYGASARTPVGLMPVTLGMRVDFWGPPPSVGTQLSGQADTAPIGEDVLFVRGEFSATPDVVATAVLRALLVPDARQPAATSPSQPDRGATAQPSIRPQFFPSDPVNRLLSLPAAELAGLTPIAIGDGSVEIGVHPHEQFERSAGIVHGGAVPIIGQLANALALASAYPTLVARRLDITTEYLRPLFVGQPACVRARITHNSRRVLVTDAEIWNSADKLVARIHETATRNPE